MPPILHGIYLSEKKVPCLSEIKILPRILYFNLLNLAVLSSHRWFNQWMNIIGLAILTWMSRTEHIIEVCDFFWRRDKSLILVEGRYDHHYNLIFDLDIFVMLIQSQLVLLHFTLLHFTDTVFFTNWRFVATLCWASLLGPLFQQRLLSLCPCVTSW